MQHPFAGILSEMEARPESLDAGTPEAIHAGLTKGTNETGSRPARPTTPALGEEGARLDKVG